MLRAREEADQRGAIRPGRDIWRPDEESVAATDPHWDPNAWGDRESLEQDRNPALKGMKAAGSASELGQGRRPTSKKG